MVVQLDPEPENTNNSCIEIMKTLPQTIQLYLEALIQSEQEANSQNSPIRNRAQEAKAEDYK